MAKWSRWNCVRKWNNHKNRRMIRVMRRVSLPIPLTHSDFCELDKQVLTYDMRRVTDDIALRLMDGHVSSSQDSISGVEL